MLLVFFSVCLFGNENISCCSGSSQYSVSYHTLGGFTVFTDLLQTLSQVFNFYLVAHWLHYQKLENHIGVEDFSFFHLTMFSVSHTYSGHPFTYSHTTLWVHLWKINSTKPDLPFTAFSSSKKWPCRSSRVYIFLSEA